MSQFIEKSGGFWIIVIENSCKYYDFDVLRGKSKKKWHSIDAKCNRL